MSTGTGAVRVGIVGVESSHAEELIRYLNVDRPDHNPLRVTALVADDKERTNELARLGGIETVVDSSAELQTRVDALFIATRDGALHRRDAMPFLEAGTPVWLDKPLAASVADAQAMVDAAGRGGTALTSSTALRWVPDADEIAERLGTIGDLQTLTVTGPADEFDPRSGIFFYGIHAADLAQRFVPGEPESIDVQRVRGGIVVRYRTRDILVTLELVRPDSIGKVPFRIAAVGGHGVVDRSFMLEDSYFEPGADAFARMLSSGVPAVSVEEMIASVRVLEQVRNAL